LFDQQMYKRK